MTKHTCETCGATLPTPGAPCRRCSMELAVGSKAELAQRLGISENAVRVALHRLRRRFGELVRDEVRETVGPGEIEDEVQQLLRALE